MKKSTLITTIAMIVVVVIALSTATYAWFSSAEKVNATTTITTQSSADWSLAEGKLNTLAASNAITWNTANGDISMNASMAGGLFCPYAEIATTTTGTSTAALTALDGMAKWMVAQVTGTTYNVTEKHEVTAGDNPTVKGVIVPNYLLVTNSKGEPKSQKGLRLNVIITIGKDTNSSTAVLAAKALSFYVNSFNGVSTYKTATNGYYYSDASALYAVNSSGATTVNTVISPSSKTKVDASNLYTEGGRLAARPDYDTSISDFKTATETEVTDYNMTTGDKYLLYTVDLGTVTFNSSLMLTIYTWLDGWTADQSATGASLGVIYSFNTY